MSLWKRVGCQTESKASEKSIVKRIVQELGLGLLNQPEMDREELNLIECRPSRVETSLAGRENGIRFQKEEKTR